MKFQNPILRGFYPDPSICRAGEDYYLVTSSFEFFPGVPLFHSKNLVNWRQLGHCLESDRTLNLRNCRASGGIYAPTLRYHEGHFYMVTTNVTGGGHLIVHTDDPARGWSEPVWVDMPGIDPSLLFDGGKVYFCSTGSKEGREAIWLVEVDPLTGEKTSLPVCISFGCGGRYPEAPHIYHIGEYYYLMLAEGGTEYGHSITIQRSEHLYGPYSPCPHNPILSHRDRMFCNIQATGHGDLLEDANGNWWMVCLAIRQLPGVMLHNLGRETFLAPVRWENGWPVVGNQGLIDYEMEGPLPQSPEPVQVCFEDHFGLPTIAPRWSFIRNPRPGSHALTEKGLVLRAADTLSMPGGSPAFVGVRQPEFRIAAEAVLQSPSQSGTLAGLTAYYNNSHYYALHISKQPSGLHAFLCRRVYDVEAVSDSVSLPDMESIRLRIEADEEHYSFFCILPDGNRVRIGSGRTAGLCTEGTESMTFTGVFLGLFCEKNEAVFSSFKLLPTEE